MMIRCDISFVCLRTWTINSFSSVLLRPPVASWAGSCDQWSPNTNWLPSTFSVQEIVTEYIILDGDWVGEGEGDWGGVTVCVSQTQSSCSRPPWHVHADNRRTFMSLQRES